MKEKKNKNNNNNKAKKKYLNNKVVFYTFSVLLFHCTKNEELNTFSPYPQNIKKKLITENSMVIFPL